MKTLNMRIFFICVISLGICSAQETDQEVKKIDTRLNELRTIYNQEQAIINAYTKNRTVPVREGTKEYQACLVASKRIQQAETEAKILKEKRALVVAGTNNKESTQVDNLQPDQPKERQPSDPFGGNADRSIPKPTTLNSSIDVTSYVDRVSTAKQTSNTLQDAFQKLTVSDAEAEMKKVLAMAEAGEIPLNVAESRMRDLATKAIESKQNTKVSVIKLKEMAQCDDYDVFCFFVNQRINLNQINEESSGDPQAVAQVLMKRLDPRNFLNKLEHQSKTLNSINSKIELKGKNLDLISTMLDSSQYLDLCLFLLKESGDDTSNKSEVSTRHVFKAASVLADRLFYLNIAPGVHSNNMGHSRMPWVYSTESIELLGANDMKFAGSMPAIFGASDNGWSKHPDGTGYIHEWRPRDGAIMLATFNNQFNQPIDPKQIDKLTSPKSDDWDEDSMDDKLKRKLELGEITEDKYNQILAQKPKDNLRYLLSILISN